MRFKRTRLWIAGIVAFAFGFPLTERVFGGYFNLLDSSLGFGLAIADSAGDS